MADFRRHPDPKDWDDYVDFESTSWPKKDRRRYWIIPSICFNCESACGILAYVDKETLDVRKIEGNPVHPGSRGRTCAKGVVTPNQLEDPDRILYPLKRSGPRGSGEWDAGLVGRGARRHRRTHSQGDVRRIAATRSCITSAVRAKTATRTACCRPGESTAHNSHTNVCSSSARLGHFLWTGADRPSPDYAQRADDPAAVVASRDRVTTSTRMRSASSRASRTARKLIVIDPRLSNTSAKADIWMPANPGTEGALLLAIARGSCSIRGAVQPRVRAEVGQLARRTSRRAARAAADVRGVRSARCKRRTRSSRRSTPRRKRAFRAEQIVEAADAIGRAGTRVRDAQLARRGPGNLWGWQITRCLYLLVVLMGAIGEPGGVNLHVTEQVRAEASQSAAAAGLLERAAVPEGVPARVLRDELPAAALPEGRPRQARRRTSRASTTRCGRTPTASRGWRCCRTSRRSACTSR